MLTPVVTTEIVKALIGIALVVLSAALTYAVTLARKHLSPAQIDTVVEIARIVTLGVEQIAPVLGLIGPAKYAEALSRAVALASRYGITLTAADWQSYIEAAVRELKAAGQELIAPGASIAKTIGPLGAGTQLNHDGTSPVVVLEPAVPLDSGPHA